MATKEIKALDLICGSLITNIIKACETCTINRIHMMIWYEKHFFPSHVNKVTIICEMVGKILIVKSINIWFKGWEFFLCTSSLAFLLYSYITFFSFFLKKKRFNLPNVIDHSFDLLATSLYEKNTLVPLFLLRKKSIF